MIPRVDTVPRGVETPTWGVVVQQPKPSQGFEETAPPGEDNVQSLDQKSFHTSATPKNWGRKRWFPGSIPPRTVCKLQPHCLIVYWPGFIESAQPGEDIVPSPDQKSFHTSTTRTNQGRKWLSPASISPRTLWKPQAQ